MKISNDFSMALINENATFEELSRLWIFNKKEKLKQSTYLKYYYLIDRYINPVIGNFQLFSLGIQTVDAAINKIYWKNTQEHLSYSLIKSIIFVTNSILNYGKRLQLMEHLEITFEVPKNESHEIMVLSDSNIKKLVEYTIQHPSDNSLGILFCLYTGLRIGEICALQRSDIDFAKNSIHIRKTVQRLKLNRNQKTELIITKPKSTKSYREIPIPSFLSNLLKEYKIIELENTIFILGKKETPY